MSGAPSATSSSRKPMAASTPNTSGVREPGRAGGRGSPRRRRRPGCRRAGRGGCGRWWRPVAAVDGPVAGTTWSRVQPGVGRSGDHGGDSRAVGQGGQRGGLVGGGDDDLEGAGGAGPEGVGDLVVADPGVGRGGDDGDGRHWCAARSPAAAAEQQDEGGQSRPGRGGATWSRPQACRRCSSRCPWRCWPGPASGGGGFVRRRSGCPACPARPAAG